VGWSARRRTGFRLEGHLYPNDGSLVAVGWARVWSRRGGWLQKWAERAGLPRISRWASDKNRLDHFPFSDEDSDMHENMDVNIGR
jgi:hypothetical protein